MSPRKGFLGGQSPVQVQSLLDEGVTQRPWPGAWASRTKL
jgi:hypothetical protein